VIRTSHRLLASLVLAGVLSATALAPAATNPGYHGKTKDGGPVSFRLTGGAVERFQASVSTSCISAAPARSETSLYVVASAKPVKLDRKSRFTVNLNRPKEQFKDQTGKVIATLYSVKASVQGRVAGHSASGTVKVTYNKFWTAYDPSTGFYQLTLASCFSGHAATPWTAKRK
jgi:hypothetical protein